MAAACGASDSVITHTSISEELQVPNLLFSISLHRWTGLYFTDSRFYSQHNSIHWGAASVTRGPPPWGTPRLNQQKENGGNGGREALWILSFHFTGEFVKQEEERGPFISIRHALIYISHIYLHILLFCSERGKTILQKLYYSWWPDCNRSFPFSALYGVCQTQWT